MPSRPRSLAGRLVVALAVVVLLAIAAAAAALWWFLGSDRVRSGIEARASRALGEPVRISRAAASLLPRPAVRLLGVEAGEGARYARLAEVRLSTALRPLLSRRFEDAEIVLRDGSLDLEGLAGLYQAATAPGAGTAGENGAVEIGSVRTLALERVDLRAGAVTLRVDARARVDDNRLEIERLQAEGAGSRFELTGTLTGGAAPTGALSLRASVLDVEALAALAGAVDAAGASPSAPGGSPAVRLTMDVQAERGTLGGIEFADLDTRVEASGRQVRLDPLEAALMDGRFTGSAVVVPGSTGPTLSLTGTLADADATAVLAYLERPPEILTGRITANVRVEQSPGAGTPLLERLRGTLGVRARGGRIQGLSAVSRAVVGLSGRADRPAEAGTDEYDELSATFGMAGGRLDTRDLVLDTPDLQVRGRGTIDLGRGALALDADLALSPDLSQAAGRDLYRYAREGDRIVLPGRIGGTFAEPSVSLDVAEAARRALRNRLEEEGLSLLERLRRGGREP